MIKKYKSFYDEDENHYDNVDGTVESSEESENFDDIYEDGGDGYDVDYRKKKKKIRKQKKDSAITENKVMLLYR